VVDLKALCKQVNSCIARFGIVQADSQAPERLLSPEDLLSGKEMAELLVEMVHAARPGQPGQPSAIEGHTAREIEGDVGRFLLEREFELGAAPDESEAMWQTYAPREPVAAGSKVHLAIRYNAAAVKAPGARGLGVGRRKRRCLCAVRVVSDFQMVRIGPEDYEIVRSSTGREAAVEELAEEALAREPEFEGTFLLTSERWCFVEFVPRSAGLYHVSWIGFRKPKPVHWASDWFWVE
jgi:hypothetical protein